MWCLSRLKSSDLGRMWDCTFRWWWWGCLHPACTLQVSYLTPNVSLRGWQRPSSGDATIKPVMLGVREVKRKQRVMTCTFQDWKAFQLSSYQLSALTCSPPQKKTPTWKTFDWEDYQKHNTHIHKSVRNSAALFMFLKGELERVMSKSEGKASQVRNSEGIIYDTQAIEMF